MMLSTKIARVGIGGVLAASFAVADITNITQGTTHPSIQDAIDSANDHDVIVLDPGVYSDNWIDTRGKPLTLRSQDPLDPTIVVATVLGDFAETVFFLTEGEGPDTVISGVAIRDAGGFYGAVYLDHSSPTFSHCVFQDNVGEDLDAGAIYSLHSAPTITGCAFVGNVSISGRGGAIYIWGGAPTIRDCTFDRNRVMNAHGGAIAALNGSATIERCRIRGNTADEDGGGLLVHSSIVTVVDCTFLGNEATGRGGAMYVENGGHVSIVDARIESNECGTSGGGIYLDVDGVDTCSLQNSVVAVNEPDQIAGAYDDLGGNVIGDTAAPPRVMVETCPEDINGDGVVDLADLGALLAVFDQPCP